MMRPPDIRMVIGPIELAVRGLLEEGAPLSMTTTCLLCNEQISQRIYAVSELDAALKAIEDVAVRDGVAAVAHSCAGSRN